MYQGQQERISEQTQEQVAKNFGRKGFVKEVEPVAWDNFDEEVTDKKGKKNFYSTTSKYLFREINLFIPEVVGIAISILGVMLLGLFGFITNSPILIICAAGIPIIVMVVLFMARMLLFMPNKHRHLTQRILTSGAIRFSVDDIRKGEIPFDKNPMSDKVKIINPKMNTDFNTGRPVIALKEGTGNNVSLSREMGDAQQSKELSNVIDSVWGTAEAYTRYNIEKEEKNKDMLIIVALMITALCALAAAYLAYQNQDAIAQLVAASKHTASAVATAVQGTGA